MGILDNLGDLAKEHEDKIEAGIEQAGDLVDEKTGDKFADQVDQVQDLAKEQLDKLTGQ
ncbi:MT0933-like antitoxin protein [Tessaracoccus bendigoensis DSM 12906]|uniref:MT0933-like antitoxin protein n=1 Tax=Tessaracoccus bendigoensis DSM 12906 TaxID=1123357 RepID=A0A1M6AFE7_9ACTN|nr:antitoxin [Tessaracoccus bendigoensis]SHI35274.1 MT0933-like antitoxin protein [Tessaracoccus bendigoensis DSM 12906]